MLKIKELLIMRISINRYQASLIGIIILGFLVRFVYFITHYIEPADVLQYMHTSRYLLGEEHNYGNPREIGYPLLLALFGAFFGVNYDTAQYLTIFLGLFNIFVAFLLTKRVLNRWSYFEENQDEIALFTSLMVAVSPVIVKSDNLGVREPLAGLLLMFSVILLYSSEENRIRSILNTFLVFIVWFYLAITRSEFTFIGVGLACFVALEGFQFSDNRIKVKALALGCASIFAFIFWTIFSLIMFNNPAATSDMLVSFIIGRNDPNVTPQGLVWYIFNYLGFFNFLIAEIIGVGWLLSNLPDYIGLYIFILAVFGGWSMLRRSHLIIPAIYVLMAIINGFNAYAFEFIGSDRILSISFPFLFILAGIAFERIKDYNFTVTPDFSIHIPKAVSKTAILLFVTVYSLTLIYKRMF